MTEDRPAHEESCILLVDDEEVVRESLSRFLEAHGFRVLLADSYESAVGVLEENKAEIEAVICDLKMPGKSGLEVLCYLNEQNIDIPLIFLTGHATLQTCQEAVKGGAFDYILKPPKDDRIVISLRHAVEKCRLVRKNREMQKDIASIVDEIGNALDELLQDSRDKEKLETRITGILEQYGGE